MPLITLHALTKTIQKNLTSAKKKHEDTLKSLWICSDTMTVLLIISLIIRIDAYSTVSKQKEY